MDILKNDIEKEMAGGSIPRLLIKLSLPMIAAQIVNVLYNIVDRIYIGRIEGVGINALAGVGITMPIIVLISAFAALIGMGGAPLASIKMGENNKDGASMILSNAFSLLIGFGIFLTVVFYLLKDKLLYVFGASPDIFEYGNQYISIYIMGSIFVMLTLGMNSFINAQGFAKIGMATVVIGAIINIVLDPILIFGFKMGVRGAALATIISQGVSAAWALKFLFGSRTILKIKKEWLKPKWNTVKGMFALGLSPFIMQSTESILQIVFNINLQTFGGDIYISIMTVLMSLMQVMFLPLQGLAQGAQPILGYNYGARQYDRVKKTMQYLVGICVGFSVLTWVIAQTIPGLLIRIFNDDPQLISMGMSCVRVYFAMQFMMGLQISCQQAFVSLGKAKFAIFFALLRKVILLIPLIILLPRIGGGVMSIFAAEPISDTISASACFITFMLFARKLGKDDIY